MSKPSKEDVMKADLQMFQICLNVLSHFAKLASSSTDMHILCNLQYSMKYVFDKATQVSAELQAYKANTARDTPLHSTIVGGGALKANEAMDILSKMYASKKSGI
jgi:hypothetical protein